MNYLTIVEIIKTVLYFTFFAMMAHYVVFGIVGVFTKKKFPVSEKKIRNAMKSFFILQSKIISY